jgi:DNA invertase Pin-like site-specific DNA recombinase
MIYGYARVSTKLQASDGNSLEAQALQLKQAGASKIYKDAFTGTKAARPELDKLKEVLRKGDRIIVTKLDRLARSTEDGLNLVKHWHDQGISIHVLNMGLIDSTPSGKLILTVMLAFAEFERDMICERTQEGRAIARLDPEYKEGRKKKFTRQQIAHALDLLENNSYTQVVKMTGISKSTLIRANNDKKDEYREYPIEKIG